LSIPNSGKASVGNGQLYGHGSMLLATLTDRSGMMVSRAAVEQHGKDFARNPLGTGPFQFGEFQPSSDRSSSWFPLTQNLANRAIVRATISADLETMIDLRLKRPNQWRCRQ
jgi:hypothetical protein